MPPASAPGSSCGRPLLVGGCVGLGLRGAGREELRRIAGSDVDGQQTVAAQLNDTRTALDLVSGQQVAGRPQHRPPRVAVHNTQRHACF